MKITERNRQNHRQLLNTLRFNLRASEPKVFRKMKQFERKVIPENNNP